VSDLDGGAEVHVVRFGETEVDVRALEVRRGGAVQPVEPQVFDVLVHLIRHRDQVVSKEGHRRQRRHVHLRDRGSRTLDSSRRVWEADGLPGGPHLADLLSFEPTGLPREARA
jgi:DNA-binding response OmpR family regulator